MDIDKKILTNFIKTTLPIADNIANSIAENFEQTLFGKNDFLLKQGKISNDYIFLETGFIRAFTYDTEGNEVTTNIYSKNSIVFEAASFIKRTPTKENIQALTDCTVWLIKYETFQKLFHSIPEFREFGRENLVNGFISLKERTLAMINLTAEQRYENLLNTRPDIFQNVSLKHLASYLGITDTSLSRIRKEIMQK
jgi:CRP-like cAMP-binding protein